MKFELLADNIHLIPEIAKLLFQEFSYLVPEKTINDFANKVKAHLNHKTLPITYVLLNEEKKLIGIFSIRKHDLDSHEHLTPWIASVVVQPDQRNQGIGAFIIKKAELIAKEMGYSYVYLFTPNKEAWYKKLGWESIEHSFFNKFPIAIMSKNMRPKNCP